MTTVPKERGVFATLTIGGTGLLVLFGGISELLSPRDPIALFGAMRVGPAALLYHFLFGVVSVACGLGLTVRSLWSERIFWLLTGLFTADRLMFLADAGARAAYVRDELHGDLLQSMLSADDVNSTLLTLSAVSLASWWLFVVYLWTRRELVWGRRSQD